VAGDFDYETHGQGYATVRRTDPRIAELVHAALGPGRTVLNVGAGAGSYEPDDRYVLAVEPSAFMRSQRSPERAPAIGGIAEKLPFDTDSVDAGMATVTIHQWSNPGQGLQELRRVVRGPVVVLTFDGDALERFWLAEYAPEVVAADRRRYPALSMIGQWLGGVTTVRPVPIPIDCLDGFTEAFYARPEMFLDPAVRRAQSAWAFVDPRAEAHAVTTLADDLESGRWDERFGTLRTRPYYHGSLRLVVAEPGRRCNRDHWIRNALSAGHDGRRAHHAVDENESGD
jgi:SAM-dependent methyltransferase